jgi:hypothetical protein
MKKSGLDAMLDEIDEARREIMAEHGNDWRKVIEYYIEEGKKNPNRGNRAATDTCLPVPRSTRPDFPAFSATRRTFFLLLPVFSCGLTRLPVRAVTFAQVKATTGARPRAHASPGAPFVVLHLRPGEVGPAVAA